MRTHVVPAARPRIPGGEPGDSTHLLEEFDVFTVQRTGIARGDCIRVTPALHNLPADLDRFAEALRTLAARG
jgi:selenocysteine lyase/cysteine desulfurase